MVSQRASRVLIGLAVLLLGWTPALAAEGIPFKDLGGDKCFMHSLLVPQLGSPAQADAKPLQLIIDNDADYDRLWLPGLVKASCSTAEATASVVKVDFSKQTVLAFWRAGSCADADFTRQIMRDDASKQIVYVVGTVAGAKPFCTGPGPQSLNLVAIPKIPDGYTVEFKTE